MCIRDRHNTGVFTDEQLQAFSASLRAAAATRLDQPSSRSMQTMSALEHFFTQSDWDTLHEPAKLPGTHGTDAMEDVVAIRLHRAGVMCAGTETLKRASAVIQACVTPSDMHK